MKKVMLCAVAAVIAVIAPLAMRAENPNKILIAYFSWGGNTQTVAEYIAEQAQGELFRIEPVKPYPTQYTPCTEVALEERDSNARPAIMDRVENWDDYDVIFIGCPVWWHEAPMIIHTFAESYNFEGKTVVPFCTYAATFRDETLAKIVEITPAAKHLEGYGVSGRSTGGVTEWLDRIGISVRAGLNGDNSGIENVVDIENDFNIYIYGDQLYLTDLESGAAVRVYDVMGNLIYSGNEHHMTLDNHGMYILLVDNQTVKIKI